MIEITTAFEPGVSGIVLRGQLYSLKRYEPREGRTPLAVFETACANCGEPFEVKSTLKIHWLSRRCIDHKAPGRTVKS